MSRMPYTDLSLAVRDPHGSRTVHRIYHKDVLFVPWQPRKGESVVLLDDDRLVGPNQDEQISVKIEEVAWRVSTGRQFLLLEPLTPQEHTEQVAKALVESGWTASQ